MNDDLIEHAPVLPSGGKMISDKEFINFVLAKRFEKCALMIVFTLMFGAVIAFVYSMTYTYLETQARFQVFTT